MSEPKCLSTFGISAFAQGFGCRPSTAVQHPLAAGVRKPPRNEPAEDRAERLPPVRYGELSGAESVGVGPQRRWRRLMTRLADNNSSICWSGLSLRVAVAGWVR